MFKKLSILLAVCMLTMSLAACGSSSSSSYSSSGSGARTNTKTYVVSVDVEYLNALYHAAVDEAGNLGVDMDLRYAGQDSNKVIDCIEQAKAEKKDAVIVNLVSSADAEACIEAAGDMKIIFINRIPYDESLPLLKDNAAAVASDEHDSGGFQGDFLVDYFAKKGQKDVKYVLLQGTPDLVHTVLRSEVPVQKMTDAGINLTEVKTIMADYNRSNAAAAMEEFLKENKDFDLVLSNNDAMAMGAIQAMKELDIDPADYTIVGIDGLSDAKNAITKGEMTMTVFQSYEGQAKGSIQAAVNMLDGKDLTEGIDCTVSPDCDRLIYIPFEPITADNVADYK
ncbi:MAG: substrate-binding domain-containing protein [Eubacteriales bacterium]|nr:substrate-binding domain-containing protein [Eubacteriales bacterium]